MILEAGEKRRRFLRRVAGAVDGKVYIGPEQVYLPVTNRCNLSCRYCWFHSPGNPLRLHPRQDMPLADFKRIVRECVALEVDTLFLSAEGEPTLHPEFFSMMSFLKKQPLEVTIFSNGTFSSARRKDVLKADRIGINLGAPEREGYKLLQGEDLFDHVIKNINFLVKARDKNKKSFKIGVDYVVNKDNIHQIKETEKFLSCLGVDSFTPTLMKEHDWNGGVRVDDPSTLFLAEGKPSPRCFHGWFQMIRALDGRIRLCPQLSQEIIVVDQNSLRETWFSDKFMESRLRGRCGDFGKKFRDCRQCLYHQRNTAVLKRVLKRTV